MRTRVEVGGIRVRRRSAAGATAAEPPHANLLVIGYGNTLRSDDAAGVRVAEALAALRLPGVQTCPCHQLTPELAEGIAAAGQVVFVDAAVSRGRGAVRLRPLRPSSAGAASLTHLSDPRVLLALTRQLFGRAPRAWWLTIPASRFDFGEALSLQARRGVARAVTMIRTLALGRKKSRALRTGDTRPPAAKDRRRGTAS